MNLAESFYEDGGHKFTYERYLTNDGARWVLHGRFYTYHRNGQLASEGNYANGLEDGLWRYYHESGELAAEGRYKDGIDTGEWLY
ncbi:toxin-antitoxin system YwqK family antitoxin [Massilia sp. 2TAF26]|uniref:toxin-antitoxin system YwqK family antitoxin n=1 Tax=Massilia sp. 2TAF26 TaxID=3233012 RepID=UPI003F99036E